MKLKENIYNSIKKMNIEQLTLLYEQIKLMENMKSISVKKDKIPTIEEIHAMTNSSSSCWSDSVIEWRVDRI